MKKLIIAIFAVIIMVPMFTSCNKGDKKCYKVTYMTPAHQDAEGKMVGDAVYTCYKWMYSDDISTYKSELKSLGYTDIVVEEVSDSSRTKTMADCTATQE